MHTIGSLIGREILDSRGRPTVEATCVLGSGASGTCSVPSGASTGSGEAIELRDGDLRRYRGLGCRRAASHISQEIFRSVAGSEFAHQSDFDRQLITLDGTPDKSRLGATGILPGVCSRCSRLSPGPAVSSLCRSGGTSAADPASVDD